VPAELADVRERRARLDSRFGWGGGILLVLVAVAGADHPPPPGFLWIVLFAGVVVWAVRRGLPSVLGEWDARGGASALMIAGGTGLGLGVVAWGAAYAVLIVGQLDAPDAASLLLRWGSGGRSWPPLKHRRGQATQGEVGQI
jgi:hypothetical protein